MCLTHLTMTVSFPSINWHRPIDHLDLGVSDRIEPSLASLELGT